MMNQVNDYDAFEATLAAEPPVNAELGSVEMVVARKGGGVHEVLALGRLNREEGLVGDRWTSEKDPSGASQITLMRAGVVRALTGGELVATSGDNFQVAFELSEQALPAGTRLRLGTAVIEVTDEPHNGCKLFIERFGLQAMKWVNAKTPAPRRLRGIHCRVLENGEVKPGDEIRRMA